MAQTSMNTHPPTLFAIATGSADPIYRQLIEQTRRLVAANVLLPGDVLPSVREVAQTLALNPMTVSKAYNMLETEGLLQRSRGVGMLVAPRSSANGRHQREALLRPTLERAAQEARQLELDPETVIALFEKILKEAP
jgi:GntR family transcriptional regulator